MTSSLIQKRLEARIIAANTWLSLRNHDRFSGVLRFTVLRREGNTYFIREWPKPDLPPAPRWYTPENPVSYASYFVMYGTLCRNRFDENPDYAYSHLEATRIGGYFPRYLSLPEARERAFDIWAIGKSSEVAENIEFDGKFVRNPDIVIFDQDRKAIDEFDGHSWIDEVVPESQLDELINHAQAVRLAYITASRSQNLHTFAMLKRKADKLKRAVEIAERRPSVIL